DLISTRSPPMRKIPADSIDWTCSDNRRGGRINIRYEAGVAVLQVDGVHRSKRRSGRRGSGAQLLEKVESAVHLHRRAAIEDRWSHESRGSGLGIDHVERRIKP